MQTIEETFSATVEEKKSTFLAYLCPMSSFDALHQKLKNDTQKQHILYGLSAILMNTVKL